MPLYLTDATWDAEQPLADVLDGVERLVQLSGGRLLQALQTGDGLSLTIETADELSMFRVAREAAGLGLELRARPALARLEAEALDAAHRQRAVDVQE